MTPAPHDDVEPTTFFAVADIGQAQAVGSPSDGDLWPSTWADDGHLYAACGDGLGFDLSAPWGDIVVNRIVGTPEEGLTGERLAAGDDVAPVWTEPGRFNRKPTGMVAVDGDGDGSDELYLAVQDLYCVPGDGIFNEAPAAGIVRSLDHGRTWTAPDAPQFTDHIFTTVMFVDLGQSNEHSARIGEPGMVYAVGLDHNWRTSYSASVPNPESLYLARVRADSIMDRDSWQFFAGLVDGEPTWSADTRDRVAVLEDGTKHHPAHYPASGGSGTISQGGVVYVPAFDRFVYSSWSEFTLELYEAPRPWGPWRHVVCRAFGPFPWVGPRGEHPRHGGYGTTIPSKFISPDGRSAWLQSNWFVTASTYAGRTYEFSLRPVRLEPLGPAPADVPDGTNLAHLAGTWPISTGARSGHLEVMNDGATDRAEDSWTGEHVEEHHWGYAWPFELRLARLRYTVGPYDLAGGWFATTPRVEVRRDGVWHELEAEVAPEYVRAAPPGEPRTYEFTFAPTVADGVRLVGVPGGYERYTAISELEVFSA